MANYFFGRIPDDKWKDFKTACAYFKIPMRQVFLNVVDKYIEAHVKLLDHFENTEKIIIKEDKE